jgi:hypothetical protein
MLRPVGPVGPAESAKPPAAIRQPIAAASPDDVATVIGVARARSAALGLSLFARPAAAGCAVVPGQAWGRPGPFGSGGRGMGGHKVPGRITRALRTGITDPGEQGIFL